MRVFPRMPMVTSPPTATWRSCGHIDAPAVPRSTSGPCRRRGLLASRHVAELVVAGGARDPVVLHQAFPAIIAADVDAAQRSQPAFTAAVGVAGEGAGDAVGMGLEQRFEGAVAGEGIPE